MVLGTGIDIVETERIAQAVERFGQRFLDRVFHAGEVEYARTMKKPNLHLAARFAAKEAISKAFGTGIGRLLGWKDIEICRRESGEPYVVMRGKGAELARARGVPLLQAARLIVETEELKPKPRRALADLIAAFDRWRSLIESM
ncbi:MAG: holo-ACP synthase, partial [Verrucomicrobiae bacterium]|nr:holo-ACP synthase [Verrucomicrobiae bacterium]